MSDLKNELARLEHNIREYHPRLWENLWPGLSIEQLERVQEQMNCHFTQEIIELYKWRNGTRLWWFGRSEPPEGWVENTDFEIASYFMPLGYALDLPLLVSDLNGDSSYYQRFYERVGLMRNGEWAGAIVPFSQFFLEGDGPYSMSLCPCTKKQHEFLPLLNTGGHAEPFWFSSDSIKTKIMEINFLYEEGGLIVNSSNPYRLSSGRTDSEAIHNKLEEIHPRSQRFNAVLGW